MAQFLAAGLRGPGRGGDRHPAAEPARRGRRGGQRRARHHRAARHLRRPAGHPARAGGRRLRGGRPVRPDRAAPAAGRRRAPGEDLDRRGADRLLRRDPADRRPVPARPRRARGAPAAARSDAEISDLAEPENRFEKKDVSLLEVYTRVWSPEGEPLLFEAYYSAADVARQRQQIYDSFGPITLGGLLVLVAVTTPLLWALTRRLERTGRDRERLLEAAADASESERRRIARDLHDGVVQDLAGTSYALSATARDPGTDPEHRARLEPMAGALRSSLRSPALAAGRDLPARARRRRARGDARRPGGDRGAGRRARRRRGVRRPGRLRRRGPPRLAGRPGGRAQRAAARPGRAPHRPGRHGRGPDHPRRHRRRRGLRPATGTPPGSACAACATWSREAGGRLDVRSSAGRGHHRARGGAAMTRAG